MITESLDDFAQKLPTQAEVVCFGRLVFIVSLIIDQWPQQNFGSLFHEHKDVVGDDAVMIAGLLRAWDVNTGVIGTALGDNHWADWIVEQIKAKGILSEIRREPQLGTILSVLVSDSSGARTYFWENKYEVLKTLDTANLSLLQGSRLLYVDWYDEDHIIRPMEEAARLGIPVYLNLEHGHEKPELLPRYVGRSTFCQAVTDAAQRGDEPPQDVARKLLQAGAKTAIVTLAGEGCLVVRDTEAFRVWAPDIIPVDSFGAGAVFSTGFIYGMLQGWSLEETAKFATASASLKVSKAGLKTPDLEESKKLSAQLKVQKLTDSQL